MPIRSDATEITGLCLDHFAYCKMVKTRRLIDIFVLPPVLAVWRTKLSNSDNCIGHPCLLGRSFASCLVESENYGYKVECCQSAVEYEWRLSNFKAIEFSTFVIYIVECGAIKKINVWFEESHTKKRTQIHATDSWISEHWFDVLYKTLYNQHIKSPEKLS